MQFLVLFCKEGTHESKVPWTLRVTTRPGKGVFPDMATSPRSLLLLSQWHRGREGKRTGLSLKAMECPRDRAVEIPEN